MINLRSFLGGALPASALSATASLSASALSAGDARATGGVQPGKFREPSRDIPVCNDADVIVCGGGPAGIGAAVSAARAGAQG